jgi:hypothetical protein
MKHFEHDDMALEVQRSLKVPEEQQLPSDEVDDSAYENMVRVVSGQLFGRRNYFIEA